MEFEVPAGDLHGPCRAIIETLQGRVEAQGTALAEVAQLRRRIEHLEAQVRQNSQNSSRPPSSDPPWKPPKSPGPPGGRRPGGQPGHPGHGRSPLPPEQVDKIVAVRPTQCHLCGEGLSGDDPDPVRHQLHGLICPRCAQKTPATLPPGVPGGLLGPRLLAWVAYLSGVAHQSKRQIQQFLSEMFGVRISLGAIPAAERRVSEATGQSVAHAHTQAQAAPIAHADETGWRERRRLAWLWTLVTENVTVFKIATGRGLAAARALLGEFQGYLGSDRYHVYNKWPLQKRQLCWAHLTRDFRAIAEGPGVSARLGKALLCQTRRLFTFWHRVRDGTLSRTDFIWSVRRIRRKVDFSRSCPPSAASDAKSSTSSSRPAGLPMASDTLPP